jgi:hypothetical protein
MNTAHPSDRLASLLFLAYSSVNYKRFRCCVRSLRGLLVSMGTLTLAHEQADGSRAAATLAASAVAAVCHVSVQSLARGRLLSSDSS